MSTWGPGGVLPGQLGMGSTWDGNMVKLWVPYGLKNLS